MSQVCNPSIPPEQCTLETCCLADQGSVDYLPSLAGNVVYLAIFAILAIAQLGLGVRFKTWGFMVGTTVGCIGELTGYGGRIWMHYSIFASNPFLVYLVPLTIAPAFITASLYLTLGRLIQAYGSHLSLLPAGWYAAIFVSFDFISLLLQAAGGAITSIADSGSSLQNTGVNIMIGGLSFQVASLALYMLLFGWFYFNVYRKFSSRNIRFSSLTGSKRFHYFEVALALATVLIFIRCCFRVAELKEGFGGAIANSEPLFMVFEGPMIFIAVGLLTVFHPGIIFEGRWSEANFGVFKGKTVEAPSASNTHWTELESANGSETPLKAHR